MTYPPHNITAAHAKGTTQLRVSLLAVWLTKFGEAHKQDPKLMALYGLIAPSLAACMESCGAGSKQKQSAAVLRRADMEITWVERVRIDELGPQPETPDAWASWWIARNEELQRRVMELEELKDLAINLFHWVRSHYPNINDMINPVLTNRVYAKEQDDD